MIEQHTVESLVNIAPATKYYTTSLCAIPKFRVMISTNYKRKLKINSQKMRFEVWSCIAVCDECSYFNWKELKNDVFSEPNLFFFLLFLTRRHFVKNNNSINQLDAWATSWVLRTNNLQLSAHFRYLNTHTHIPKCHI